MRCYKPIVVRHDEVPSTVPCGRCNFCLQNKRNSWAFRLAVEQQDSYTADFVTLTYDPTHVPYLWGEDGAIEGLTLDKQDLYTFLTTVKQAQRRLLKKEYKQWKIRYYAVGEYGTRFGRPHYHGIFFNLHPEIKNRIMNGMIWSKGHTRFGTVTQASISYTAKYCIDKQEDYPGDEDKDKRIVKPFSTMSRNPGIGYRYVEKNREWHRPNMTLNPDDWKIYCMKDGHKVMMPRYYKTKIFVENRPEYEDVFETSIELYNAEMAEKFELQFVAELDELYAQYGTELLALEKWNERRKHAHDSIKIKSLQSNKL